MLPVVLAVVVIVVAIFAVVAVGRALLGRGEPMAPADDSATRALLRTDNDRSVRMSVRGPIVADEEFNSYVIEVSPIARNMTTHQGYQGRVIESERFGNSAGAYGEFVHALGKVGFTNEVELPEEQEDTRGVCAGGRLYTFEILQAQSVVKSLWTSSCRQIPGSFRGEAVQARDLFLKQIPDSNTLLRDISI